MHVVTLAATTLGSWYCGQPPEVVAVPLALLLQTFEASRQYLVHTFRLQEKTWLLQGCFVTAAATGVLCSP